MSSQTNPMPTFGNFAAVRFHVLADADPGLLPRLLQPFAKRHLTPDAIQATREGDLMRIEVTLHAMPAEMVHLAAGNLGQIFGVRVVRMCRDGDTVLLAA